MTQSGWFYPEQRKPRGRSLAKYLLPAMVCILIGVLIASNIDLSSKSRAVVPLNIAQTGALPVVERDGGLESPFVAVVDRYNEAVVNISAKSRGQSGPWWFGRSYSSTSLGSGFFFREDGYILTNNHVVADAVEMTVRTASGYEYQAELVGGDPQTDLAVIKVEPEDEIVTIPFGNSDEIKVGDWAIAIGNPFPQVGLDRTVTVGVISAKGRSNLRFGEDSPYYQNYIQTDASINPGNSGGPLMNIRGECIGVNSGITSPTGSSVGIGFAIPINLAKSIVPDLIATGTVSRGWLGVYLSEVTIREARQQGMHGVYGVRIDEVVGDSPADRAGIESGDIVVRFNSQDVQGTGQFSVLVSTLDAGQQVPIQVIRDGEEVSLTATIGRSGESRLASQAQPRILRDRWLGMDLVTFNDDLAELIGMETVEGLYVARVYRGGPADRASIAEGTIILEINNQAVSEIADVARIQRSVDESKSRVPLLVLEPDGTPARKICRVR
ncbi:MAG: trypsin-like peptidase domain-containing protein [Candidatus Zixiibacteriota bacterium]|nr:MAG: trypsin-like peptidase domain-containing protein [candidate division Zixibacteria bacterium]